MAKKNLADWLKSASSLEKQINQVILGQENPIRLILISIFARGHLVTAKELFHSQSKTVFKESNLEESVVEALHNLSREL